MLIPGTRLGTYEIAVRIGAGGMGEVYRAKDTRLGREVAIKVLPPAFALETGRLRRFEQEARAASALNHPNITTIHELGTFEGSPYLVMELLEGDTFRARMAKGSLDPLKVIELAEQVALGLTAAHERGIVHRDLKPENLFITRDGRVKILDFGLAKRSALDDPGLTEGAATASGMVLGTLSYMSPEQACGKPVEYHSDQFSLGIVLYELLSGERPFKGESAAETLAAIVRDEPPELERLHPGLPHALTGIVRRCLAKEPHERFSSTRDLAHQLALARSQHRTAETAAIRSAHAPRSVRRHLALAAALVMVTVLAASSVWWFLKPPSRANASLVALPAKVMGAAEDAYLTDAVPDTLSTLLAGVSGLETKVPLDSLHMEKFRGDLSRIASAYQVRHLVLTSLRCQGDRLVLDVKLAEGESQKVTWAAQFEGTKTGYNQLIRQAAESVAQMLKPGGAISGSKDSSEVELLLQEALFHKSRYEANGHQQFFNLAKAALEHAVKLAPQSSRCAEAMAWLIWSKGNREGENQTFPGMESWARKAIALDPRNGSAWSALASSRKLRSLDDLDEAFGWAVKGLRLAPRDPGVNANIGGISPLASLMVACGLHSFELDPLRAEAGMTASGLIWLGRAQEALTILDRELALVPDDTFVLSARGFALTRLGRLQEAQETLARCKPEPSSTVSFTRDYWNQVHFTTVTAQGNDEASRALGRQLVVRYLDPQTDAANLVNGAITMAPEMMRLGMREEILKLFERGAAMGYAPGFDWLERNTELRSLRGDPRFERVRETARQGTVICIKHLQEAEIAGELPAYLKPTLAELKELLAKSR